ncbi:putative oligomerization/nucleic acid binding protein [Rhodococcus sp. SMB37]|uniref:SHOCT domain-containing protein n=1 Tax=Rhodococcus sp. SMB37 TaxID=2512213 RepID=UPI0006D21DDF|nr:SHOCT domain-containing protein [Rhodococcus sp. SMB37]TCN46749.1 putative oligomerization/nucleic acid binding protein [Rhodococcus sp. SMB37]
MVFRRGRVGRPGLLGTVARTAVISGTATATSNAINRRGQQRAAEKQAYTEQQAPPPPQDYPAPAPPGPPASSDDLVAKLKQLGELHTAGVLSDDEFAAAKKQLLG